MSEIEKAIQDLNEIKQQFEYSINEAKCGNDDAIEAFDDNKSAVQSLDDAIATLREKAEREKGCEYCNSTAFDVVGLDDCCGIKGVALYGGNSRPDTEHCFKYCPKCGRRLRQANEHS